MISSMITDEMTHQMNPVMTSPELLNPTLVVCQSTSDETGIIFLFFQCCDISVYCDWIAWIIVLCFDLLCVWTVQEGKIKNIT